MSELNADEYSEYIVREAKPSEPKIQELIAEHISHMRSLPQESFAFDISQLAAPNITLWCVVQADEIHAIGALKEFSNDHYLCGELKSMRVTESQRGKGLARKLLDAIFAEARSRAYRNIYLETGPGEDFKPARTLYEKYGFQYCEVFGDYPPDLISVFMMRHVS